MNPQRGEIALVLKGVAFTLCPTFGTLAALEAELNTGLLALARKFVGGDFTLKELAAVVASGIKGSGETPPPDLGEKLAQEGVAGLARPVGEYLARALTGTVPPPHG